MCTLRALGLVAAFAAGSVAIGHAADAATPVKLAVDDEVLVADLAGALGYFKEAGIEIVPVKVESFEKEDYLMQGPLNRGQIDASIHWFQHTVFGARHNLPVTAVMLFNDAPGMTVLVANRVKDQIHGAADFKGRRVAQGAGYATKSVITTYLASHAGLPPGSYTPVYPETQGRQEAVLQGLRDGKVDVMTFQEPLTSVLLKTGQVSVLYDLNSRESTAKALGATWPAQSLLMAPKYIQAHPEAVQKLTTAFVRTMRFINTHTAQQIADKLPTSYFAGKDRAEETRYIAQTLSTYARGDYSLPAEAVKLEVGALTSSSFDDSEEGRWRRTAEHPAVDAESLYDNRFVRRAMQEYK